MIKWLLDEFLLILLLNIPYDSVKFISYASYRNNHRKEVKFWPKIKILVALDIKIGDFNWKGQEKDHERRKCNKILKNWSLTTTVDHWPCNRSVEQPVDRIVGVENLKRPLRASFLTFPPLELVAPSHTCF